VGVIIALAAIGRNAFGPASPAAVAQETALDEDEEEDLTNR
jgi:hypothetical protein